MTLCHTLARRGGRSRRTPPRVPAVPHLLGHRTVDILGNTAGHQIDRGGTNKVPAKSCVVLQAIAGAVLRVGREQGGNRVLVSGWSPARPPPSTAQIHLARKLIAIFAPSLQTGLQLISQHGQGHTSFHFPSGSHH